MSLSSCQMTRPRQIAFGCFLLAQTQGSNPNRSSEQQVEAPTDGPQQIQDRTRILEVDAEPEILILIWMWPFGYKFGLSCEDYNYRGCRLTDDKSLYHEAHGVVIHHRDIHGNLDNLPSEPRPWFQKWVWINLESPTHSAKLPGLDNLFNLTSSYRLDSHIPVPYAKLQPHTSEVESFQLPTKDKLLCWIVSNWNENFKRVKYYNELKQHIQIEAYGKAFGKNLDNPNYNSILSSCKFYLSFENSQHTDYITEKLFHPLTLGTVPVVLGVTRENCEDHVPGDAFIHVDDFPNAKELAERLLHLDQNQTEYMRYFEWRKRYKVEDIELGRTHACRACRYLQENRGYHACHSLTKWFWDQ